MDSKAIGEYLGIALLEGILGVSLWGFGAPSWAIFGFCFVFYFDLVHFAKE